MNVKRVVSGLVLFPVAAAILILGNKYVVDVAVAILAIMCLHEFYKAFKTGEKANPITWIGYVLAGMISLIHVLPKEWTVKTIGLLLPITLCILFLYVIIKNLKVNIIDIAVTFIGIFYIVIFLMYISVIHENLEHGKLLIWFLFLTAWGTDIFAYVVGKTLGKHHFTEISPKKTIEGCIGGIIGAVVITIFYSVLCKYAFHVEFNYIYVVLITIVLSILSQIGDLAASSVKRYTGIKDFSNLIPGHGGMLDRIDSVIFAAPFAYFLFMFLL